MQRTLVGRVWRNMGRLFSEQDSHSASTSSSSAWRCASNEASSSSTTAAKPPTPSQASPSASSPPSTSSSSTQATPPSKRPPVGNLPISNISEEQRAAEKLQKLQQKGGIRLRQGGPVYTKETASDYFKDSPFIGAMSLVNPPTPERIRGMVLMERTATVWMYAKKGLGFAAVAVFAAWVAVYTPFFSSTQKLIRQIKNAKDVALVNLNLSRFAWMGPFDLYAIRIAHENGIEVLLTRLKPSQHPSTRILALRALVSLSKSDVGLEDLRGDPIVFEAVERILADPSYRSCDKYETTEKYVRIPYDPEEVDEQLQVEARKLAQALADSRRRPVNTRQRLQKLPVVGWLYNPENVGSGAF